MPMLTTDLFNRAVKLTTDQVKRASDTAEQVTRKANETRQSTLEMARSLAKDVCDQTNARLTSTQERINQAQQHLNQALEQVGEWGTERIGQRLTESLDHLSKNKVVNQVTDFLKTRQQTADSNTQDDSDSTDLHEATEQEETADLNDAKSDHLKEETIETSSEAEEEEVAGVAGEEKVAGEEEVPEVTGADEVAKDKEEL